MTAALPSTLIEACCDAVQQAREAISYGANRIELCGPGDGGTTPSLGLMWQCRETVRVPIHVMIRPHTRSFVYDDDDFAVMCHDIVAAKGLNMDGIVLGPLHTNGTIASDQLAKCVALARPMKVAFHRAFDRTPDAVAALDVLLSEGVDYVLTSGHARTASEGAPMLRSLQHRAGSNLVVLAGGSVRGDTVRQLVTDSMVREVHARATDPTIIRDVATALTNH